MKSDGAPSWGVIVVWAFMFTWMVVIDLFRGVRANAAGEDYLGKQKSKDDLQSPGSQARSSAD